MESDTKSPVAVWLRQPASWLSLIAATISVATFILVYAYKGELQIILPDRVLIAVTHHDPSLKRGDLSVVVPLVFTNTGSPRTVRHIVQIKASVKAIAPLDKLPTDVDVRWRMEYRFGKKEGAGFMEDSMHYVNRAFPFALFGGTSVQKLFELVQVRTGEDFEKEFVDGFSLKVNAYTVAGLASSHTAHYKCNDLKLEERDWKHCHLALSAKDRINSSP